MQTAFYQSPLGRIRLACENNYLIELKFIGEFPDSNNTNPALTKPPEQGTTANLPPILQETFRWLDLYFSGQKPDFIPTYKLLNATPFRARVNELIAHIPYGETVTYSDLAHQISNQVKTNSSSQMSAQAIGGAVGWNPICLIVPCHRVLGANFNLTGYAGGVTRKLHLLTLEHHDPTKFTFPKPRQTKNPNIGNQSTDPNPNIQEPTITTIKPKSPPIILQTSSISHRDQQNIPDQIHRDHQDSPSQILQNHRDTSDHNHQIHQNADYQHHFRKPTADTPRCRWLNLSNPTYVTYHDTEWAVPNFDDHHLFECIVLESFQAGLSWECVLSKREGFRAAYDNFDLDKVCAYDDTKIAAMARDPHIIRNPIKIATTVANARIFRDICEEFGTFYYYLCTFTGGHLIYEIGKTKSILSDRISADLQRRGMKFTGSTIIYSYLQATGFIQSHDPECFLYKDPALYNPPSLQL